MLADSSAVAISLADGSTDVVTIPDGQRRTPDAVIDAALDLIEDGVAPSWSPDGRHIAYLRCPEGARPRRYKPNAGASRHGRRRSDAAQRLGLGRLADGFALGRWQRRSFRRSGHRTAACSS